MTREILYLTDILLSIEKIERYITGISFEEFMDDDLRIDGVSRNLEIIGEGVKNLPTDLRAHAPDIEWNDIVGMRNKLIHEYWGTDLDIVWKAAHRDLPKLKLEVQKLIKKLEPPTSNLKS
ncbi:MAG: DUF86 domain-containing protein [Bacteroidota bacterium]